MDRLPTPLLIAAELAAHQRMHTLAKPFLERRPLPEDARDRSDTAIESRLTLAGGCYGYVSLPIFQFLLCRWYFLGC